VDVGTVRGGGDFSAGLRSRAVVVSLTALLAYQEKLLARET
jgi:hypothetical protein